MDAVYVLFCVLLAVIAALASIAVWAPRRARPRAAAVLLVAAFLPLGYFSLTEILSQPKPMSHEWFKSHVDEATVLGTISHGHWAEGADIPETQAFVAAFDEATGKLASYYAAANYSAMQWIVAALEETGGQFSPELFFDTMTGGMEVSTPFGPQTLDEFGSPILNVYIREVVKRDDGRLWNVPIFTYEGVDQFFPFEQDEYLQQPAYTKEFQGNNVG